MSAATTASDAQNGSTNVGRLNGEKSADWALPTNGRPPMMCGFQSGTSGSCSRVQRMYGTNTSLASASSKLLPSGGTSAGREESHGAALQSESDGESVRSGSRPCPTISTARNA